jgi:tRNA1Val (adenine37-N6)-methyltransferase
MPASVFHFKNFTILQDKCAMKVGTDGVLLGAWVNINNASHILDIGTGTGLIALMLAQKSNAKIDAIDIDESAFLQAEINVNASPWANRIRVVHASLQEFRPVLNFDLIVSNPPYFIDSFAPTNEARNRARQASASLSYDELLQGIIRLLTNTGRFCMILPSKEGEIFRDKAAQNGLFCNRITHVRTKIDKPVKRVLMEFSRVDEELKEDEIILREEDASFTDAYKIITKDFYPAF